MNIVSCAKRFRVAGLWTVTVAPNQARPTGDEPRLAFHLLARPHPAGIPPPTDQGPRSTSQE